MHEKVVLLHVAVQSNSAQSSGYAGTIQGADPENHAFSSSIQFPSLHLNMMLMKKKKKKKI